jgi:uncharacterized protein
MLDRYGPWALIAGGSEGLGASFAYLLAAQGINLILIARRAGPLEATAGAVRAAHGVEVRTATIDLTHPDMLAQVRAVSDDVAVGLLIVNAGGADGPAALIDQSEAEALAIIQTNVIGQTLLARHFAGPMARAGKGGIILLGSMGCIAGGKRLAVYSAAKSYVMTFAEGLWAEMKDHDVDVAALVIGRTRTPALERSEVGQGSEMATAEPDDVARFALDNLGDGPVLVPPEHEQGFTALRSMPRRKAVTIMARSLDSQTT